MLASCAQLRWGPTVFCFGALMRYCGSSLSSGSFTVRFCYSPAPGRARSAAAPRAVLVTWVYSKDTSRSGYALVDEGRGVIQLPLHRANLEPSMSGAEFSGSFIATSLAEPLQVSFVRPGPFYWNPKPF